MAESESRDRESVLGLPGAGWFLALLLGVALLFNGSRGLWAPDEGRYVAGALEMLSRHDFIGIFLNDETAHFSKPPMTYWTIAAAVATFGKSEFAARLPNALAYIATAMLLLPAGRLLTPRVPWLPMTVYATMWLPFIAAGAITTDTLLALFTTLAGVAFLHFVAGVRPRAAAIVMWLGFGLAFLTKGPPGLIPLLAFLVWLAARRDWQGLNRILMSWGVPIFLVVGFGWYILAEARFPGLLHFLLNAEVAGRVATDSFRRNGEWYDALVIFLPTLLLGGIPWLPAWLAYGRRGHMTPALAGSEDGLLLLWIGLALVIHSLAASRLPLYLLPLFAPLALWLARRLEPVVLEAKPRQVRWVVYACLGLMLASKMALGQLSPVDRDARTTARQLSGLLQEPVREVVAVDEKAPWEMRFYLDAQVRETWLRRTPYAPEFKPPRTLSEILAMTGGERGRVFAVNPMSTTEFERAVHKSGSCPVKLVNNPLVVLYRALPGGKAGCARPVAGLASTTEVSP